MSTEPIERTWDAIVIGAGPAGAFAARELALRGPRVLLVDRQHFPRFKVCGGCLNARTLGLLKASGLGELPETLGGEPLTRFALHGEGRRGSAMRPVELPIPRGIAVSRGALDQGLIDAAAAEGVRFLAGHRAALGPLEGETRLVMLPEAGLRLRARVVLAADGLGGSFLGGGAQRRSPTKEGSRVGAGALLRGRRVSGLRAGVIHMAVAPNGYVGLVRAEEGSTCVAAAFDRETIRDSGLEEAVGDVLRRCGLDGDWTADVEWRGTPPLTRTASTVALERVFLIGDAAGYVEPFTGEGISWALETAHSAAGLAEEAATEWRPELAQRWRKLYRRRIARRQRWCRAIAWGLRRPLLVRSAAALVYRAPALAAPVLAHLNAEPEGQRP